MQINISTLTHWLSRLILAPQQFQIKWACCNTHRPSASTLAFLSRAIPHIPGETNATLPSVNFPSIYLNGSHSEQQLWNQSPNTLKKKKERKKLRSLIDSKGKFWSTQGAACLGDVETTIWHPCSLAFNTGAQTSVMDKAFAEFRGQKSRDSLPLLNFLANRMYDKSKVVFEYSSVLHCKM